MPIPVISVAQMRDWEKRTWAAKRTPAEVISRVGHIVTACASHLTRPGDPILIIAGKGHNGDDARQVVLNLSDREVTLLNVSEARAGLREFQSLLPMPQALVIEGLFGIGLRGRLSPAWVKLIETVNQAQLPILSVDVPGGLDADTGEPQGAAFRATHTLTLGAPKQGLLRCSAQEYVGHLQVAPDIGLVSCPHRGPVWWTLPDDFVGHPPKRPVGGHKGSFGHLGIIAGSPGYHGAAVLAASGALRAQPGLVTLSVPEKIYAPVSAQLRSAMVHPWKQQPVLPSSLTAILVGPGLAAPDLAAVLKGEVQCLWRESPLPVIADASALDWIPKGRTATGALRVMTPHPGEAARLLGVSVKEVQSDRVAATRQLSRRFGRAWIVLKGHQTVIGRSQGDVFVNSSGNPFLAQGGSGDVLAGYLGGWLAQPALQVDPLKCLRYAVWQHGNTADRLNAQHSNWTLDELVPQLGQQGPR